MLMTIIALGTFTGLALWKFGVISVDFRTTPKEEEETRTMPLFGHLSRPKRPSLRDYFEAITDPETQENDDLDQVEEDQVDGVEFKDGAIYLNGKFFSAVITAPRKQ